MYTIFSRKQETGDKCPQCRMINVDFLDLGFGLLACFQCGAVFVRKSERKRGDFRKAPVTAPANHLGLSAEDIQTSVTPMEVGIPGEDMLYPPRLNEALGVHENEKGEIVKDNPFICGKCGKAAKSQLGLQSHMRSHK